ncbi:DUF927 domain-containing protein [Sphingomonas mesophila]|uniref:DUF927 domain-containing protein n=1 Tax=Sphingomonas mesophila TaxID=2303576 RepID=UPI000E598CBA|nr:DUF927 domain-containing protein [Sphingomonas mesophila]
MSKPPSKVVPPKNVDLKGIRTSEGKRWFHVRYDGERAWVPEAEFAGAGHKAMERLAAREIVFIGSGAWSLFMRKVAAFKRFRKRAVITEPGWAGSSFALQNGQVFSPSGTQAAIRLFDADIDKCEQAGDIEGWLDEVARPLVGQNLAIFLLMLAFVAPLLKIVRRSGNFGVEIVSTAGKGKTFLLQLIASVIGGAVDGEFGKYWIRFHTTVNGVEDIVEAHRDLPLLLDDATSFAADSGRASKGQSLFAAIFGMAQSQGKFRKGSNRPKSFRTVYVVTSNRTLANVIADIAREDAAAAADRLLTLDLGVRENRNFDHIPSTFADGTEFSRFLTAGMDRQHGTAMPHFLQKLVDHKHRNEAQLRDGIQRRIDGFLSELRLDRNDGSAMRVAEVFGLSSAAGQLAQHYGALPREFDCEAAALACYRLFQASTKRMSYAERLLELAADPGVIDLDLRAGGLAAADEFHSASGFFRTRRRGRREFLVNPSTLQRLIPDADRLLKDSEVAQMLRRDGPHLTKKRSMVEGEKPVRVHCFRLPNSAL